MLVDDEILMRETIRDCIDWGKEGFLYCGGASDGETALPIIEEVRPDILITDIRMPFMNGLELIQAVRSRWPEIKIIILSGYEDFEYARTALRMGVEDYCLKPLSSADIIRILHQVSDKVDKEAEEKKHLAKLKHREVEATLASREKLLNDLCSGFMPTSEAVHLSAALGLDLCGRYYACIISELREDGMAAWEEGKPLAADSPLVLYRALLDRTDLLRFQRSRTEVAWMVKADSLEELEDESLPFQHLQCTLADWAVDEGADSLPLSIGIGRPQERLQHIHLSLLQAQEDMHRQRIMRQHPLLDPTASAPAGSDAGYAGERYGELLAKAKQFIKDHYGEDTLTLQEVAEHVNVSPSHLSKVFSQETGQTFIEYLTQIRMRAAMELLRTSAAKSYEIAYQIGYNDAHYFSSLFKRVTGMTTREYRKQGAKSYPLPGSGGKA
jgi:two-component system response regulator YesN